MIYNNDISFNRVYANDTDIDKVYANDTLVWQKNDGEIRFASTYSMNAFQIFTTSWPGPGNYEIGKTYKVYYTNSVWTKINAFAPGSMLSRLPVVGSYGTGYWYSSDGEKRWYFNPSRKISFDDNYDRQYLLEIYAYEMYLRRYLNYDGGVTTDPFDWYNDPSSYQYIEEVYKEVPYTTYGGEEHTRIDSYVDVPGTGNSSGGGRPMMIDGIITFQCTDNSVRAEAEGTGVWFKYTGSSIIPYGDWGYLYDKPVDKLFVTGFSSNAYNIVTTTLEGNFTINGTYRIYLHDIENAPYLGDNYALYHDREDNPYNWRNGIIDYDYGISNNYYQDNGPYDSAHLFDRHILIDGVLQLETSVLWQDYAHSWGLDTWPNYKNTYDYTNYYEMLNDGGIEFTYKGNKIIPMDDWHYFQ